MTMTHRWDGVCFRQQTLEEHHRQAVGCETWLPIAGVAGSDGRSAEPAGGDLFFEHIRKSAQVGTLPPHDEFGAQVSRRAMFHAACLPCGAHVTRRS
jgi:hypothetical protein